MNDSIPPLNLFMMLAELDISALRPLPDGYLIRSCLESELDSWKQLHIDDPSQEAAYLKVLNEYFDLVYAPSGSLFFERCKLVCDVAGRIVGTGFIWPAYGSINTLHWLKVLPRLEGRGLGRGLLSSLLGSLGPQDFPVYLHTHPSSYRAIKLYSDFGFKLITTSPIGYRQNHIDESLVYLESCMPAAVFAKLGFVTAPAELLEAARLTEYEQF